MDAEIGVRDLADTFRYNMLPEIVHALGMIKGRLSDEVEEFEDLPDYEKLALLSKAQAELNYAVHWSYLQAKVTMTDSLTASMKWCRYDDEFRQKNGFRLPADPYWLAPPQGSIIPLWHRGGAPNYQPRPMICKHLQDPVKAWGREKHRWYPGPELMEDPLRTQVLEGDLAQTSTKQSNILIGETVRKSYVENPLPLHTAIKELICPPERPGKSIAIYFCSAGTVAERLANKLHKWIQRLIRNTSAISLKPRVEPLNSLKDLSFTVNRIILLVVSSTGKGDVPANGSGFVELGQSLLMSPANVKRDFRFAIFGNGDSRYSNTFNGAAVKIDTIMRQLGGAALVGGFCCGDTAVDPVPLGALKTWFAKLEPNVTEEAAQWMQKPPTIVTTKNGSNTAVTVSVTLIKEDVQRYDYCQQSLLSTLKDGSVISISPEMRGENPGSLLLTLSVRNESIKEMSCIQVLPINASSKVQRALAALNVDGSAIVDLQFPAENPNYTTFLTEFIDLELPFTNLYWLDLLPSTTHHAPTKSSLTNLPVLSVLETLRPHTTLTPPTIHHPLLLALPLLRTRTYSLASSPLYLSRHPPTPTTTIQILLKPLPTGRFSTVYLTTRPHPSPLKYRLLSSLTAPHLLTPTPTPTILIATGAGFGPVRAFLQHRIALAIAAGRTVAPLRHSVSVFVGVKEADVGVVSGVICEALALDLVDVVGVVVSCGGRRRVGDEVLRCGKLVRGKIDRGGVVFVCANEGAARGVRGAVEKVIGVGVEGMGERYLEEVF